MNKSTPGVHDDVTYKATPIFNSKNEVIGHRYYKNIDTCNLLDTDASVQIEQPAINSVEFQMMIKNLTSIFDKFVVICMDIGFQKNEIAYMLNKHPSTITRIEQRVIQRIKKTHLAMQETIENES